MGLFQLAESAANFLGPHLPYLLKGAEKIAEKVATDQLAKKASDLAKSLWGKLRPKLEAKPAAHGDTM